MKTIYKFLQPGPNRFNRPVQGGVGRGDATEPMLQITQEGTRVHVSLRELALELTMAGWIVTPPKLRRPKRSR